MHTDAVEGTVVLVLRGWKIDFEIAEVEEGVQNEALQELIVVP